MRLRSWTRLLFVTPLLALAPARISWSVPEVSEAITAGGKKQVTITLRASAELTNVALWVSPSLEGVLTLNPERFDSLSADQEYKVVLTFQGATAGEHGGTIHVKLGEATVPVPLTIALRVTRR